MPPTPVHGRLCVISDLHLGGSSGRQIFDHGPLLAGLIEDLAGNSARKPVALVINGDLIDFLAEPAAVCFDPEGAVSRLERIVADPAFRPVFDALVAFTKKPGCQLVVNLGNHDLELALPWVRERLLQILSGDNAAARGRIHLVFDGAGYRCQVGNASVLCLHGNEVDAWNVTDYEQIRRIGCDLSQGRSPEAWKPNAGARMVVEVMNEIKRDHPFVDLLKPEFQAAVPALLVIKPSLAEKIADIGRLALRMNWDKLKMRFGFLSAEEESPGSFRSRGSIGSAEPAPGVVLQQLLSGANPVFRKAWSSEIAATDLLDRVEQQMAANRLPLELINGDLQASQLGVWSAAWLHLKGGSASEKLRAALESVQKDRSFDLVAPDDTFRLIDQKVGADVRYVITGHTHLRRALKRTHGEGYYFNTGTWVRLLHLTPERLKSEPDFATVFDALKAPSLAELDRSGFVERLPTAAFLEAEGTITRAELREYKLEADGSVTFTPIPDSTLPPGA